MDRSHASSQYPRIIFVEADGDGCGSPSPKSCYSPDLGYPGCARGGKVMQGPNFQRIKPCVGHREAVRSYSGRSDVKKTRPPRPRNSG